jgi:hypothetical protein
MFHDEPFVCILTKNKVVQFLYRRLHFGHPVYQIVNVTSLQINVLLKFLLFIQVFRVATF